MIVYTASTIQKNKFIISTKLGSGGEGTVYAVEGNPDICVKIYHEQKRTPELEAKLKAMIDAPPKDPTLAAGHYSICWPTNVVYEDEACTKFLGFTMPRIDKNTFKEYHLLCDKPSIHTSVCYRLENFGTNFTYLNMYAAALNLTSCVVSIHKAGHAIGDLNDKNILVSCKDSKITIVDCDSFEIHNNKDIYSCLVYTPEYSAPEVINHKKIQNRQESDCFALAILLFKLLMLNTHPFASRGLSVEHLNTPEEKIVYGYYPYEKDISLDVIPPAYALPYSLIPPAIRYLLAQCFLEGQHMPEKRPSAKAWLVILQDEYTKMIDMVQRNDSLCKVNKRHVYPSHLSDCPWCKMKEDYFPEKIRNYKLEKNQLVNDLKYLQIMLNDLLGDGVLTKNEQQEIYNEAKLKNIDRERIDMLIKNIQIRNPSILLGEPPEISQKTFNFGIIEKNDMIRTITFSIKNNFLYHSLRISIPVLAEYITVILCPNIIENEESAKFEFIIDFNKMQDVSKGLFTKYIPIHVTNDMIDTNINIMINGTIREYFYESSEWIKINSEDYYDNLKEMTFAMARDNVLSQEEFDILEGLTRRNFIDGKTRLVSLLKMLKATKHAYYIGDYPTVSKNKILFYPVHIFSKNRTKSLVIENHYFLDDLKIEVIPHDTFLSIEPTCITIPALSKETFFVTMHPSQIPYEDHTKIMCTIDILIKSCNLPDNKLSVQVEFFFVANANPKQPFVNQWLLFLKKLFS